MGRQWGWGRRGSGGHSRLHSLLQSPQRQVYVALLMDKVPRLFNVKVPGESNAWSSWVCDTWPNLPFQLYLFWGRRERPCSLNPPGGVDPSWPSLMPPPRPGTSLELRALLLPYADLAVNSLPLLTGCFCSFLVSQGTSLVTGTRTFQVWDLRAELAEGWGMPQMPLSTAFCVRDSPPSHWMGKGTQEELLLSVKTPFVSNRTFLLLWALGCPLS